MIDFIDLSNPLWAAAGALAVLLAGHYLTVGVRQREQWRAVADEAYRGLERQAGAVSPAAPVDADLQRRLLRAAGWWKRHRLHRALAAYEECRMSWHQDAAGQPMLLDPDAHERALKRLLSLLS